MEGGDDGTMVGQVAQKWGGLLYPYAQSLIIIIFLWIYNYIYINVISVPQPNPLSLSEEAVDES